MKTAKRDRIKSEIEKKILANDLAEQKRRDEYIKSLKANESFQKYVVQGIFKEEKEKLNSIDSIPESLDYDGMGKTLVAAKAAKAIIQNILNELEG